MEKLLIITEKPSAGRNFATALGGASGTFEGDQYVIVNLYGHIMETGNPEELALDQYKETVGGFSNITGIPWSASYFDFNKKKLKKGLGETGAKTYKNIKQYLQSGYIPVVASDIDEMGEGDLLVHEILISLNYTGKIYREYHVDEGPKYIIEAMQNKKVVTRNDPKFLMAFARSNSDYLSQQLTRFATITLQERGYQLPGPVPFGRLKSRILTLLGSQIDAIKAYKPSSVFESRYKLDKLVLSNKDMKQFKTKDEWEADGLPFQAKVREVKQVPGTTKPPKPLTFTKLTGMMSQQGIPAKKTIDLFQKMYESQILSYPRTADNFITPGQFQEMLPLVDDILDLISLPSAAFTHRAPRPTHVHEGGAHGALRPGLKLPKSLDALDQEFGKGAAAIYKAVASRFLMMFLEDTEWVRHEYETETNPVFKGSIKIITKQGVTDPDEDTSDIQTSLPDLSKMAELYPHEVKSTKPANPTTQWLLNQLEKENVGTSATQPQTVAEMTGTSQRHPIRDGKILSLSMIGQVGYLAAKDTRIGSTDGTHFIHDLIKSVYKGTKTPEDVYREFTDLLVSDMAIIKASEIPLEKIGIPKRQARVMATGNWQGQEIQFNRVFAKHTFTDEEVQQLLAGQTITIDAKDKDDNDIKLTGKLAEQTYQGHNYIGFKTQRPGQVEGVWQGKQISYKGQFMDHVFTDDENTKLLAGETIHIITHKDDKEYKVYGKLEVQTYQGRKYVGFKANFESTPREGYITGTWQGEQIQYKGQFMDHVFTDDENAKLLAGDTIHIVTHKEDKEYKVFGKLEVQEYQGRKYVGFKANFEQTPRAPREGYVTGTWRGKQVQFKGEFMKHKFTDQEIEQLLAGEKITIDGKTNAGKSMTVVGGLAVQEYQGRKYVGFKAEFDTKTGKGDGRL